MIAAIVLYVFKAETHYENILDSDTLPDFRGTNTLKSERLTKHMTPAGTRTPSMTMSSSISRDVPGAVG